ncbi:MAG: beta-ketoacyl-ACP synthase III [Mariprofundaceae bacterium]|nr:beta-ketoacyl-ACP synthase III [Mariprofundaceae bacterium]
MNPLLASKQATVHIRGLGGYLPERVMSNDELAAMVDTSDEWIRSRTGITQRHLVAPDEMTADLACKAGKQALDDAGLIVADLDALVVATTTPDMIFPATASIVQAKLGGQGFPAWDIQAVCSGFVYGLAQLEGMMRAGMFRHVLLIGAESMSRIVDWSDRNTCVLFGDGAGAVVLSIGDDDACGIMRSVLHCDGAYRELLMAKHANRGRPPQSGQSVSMNVDAAGVSAIHMRGNEVFRIAVNKLGEVVTEVLAANAMKKSDIDWLIPHQANIRILHATAKKLHLPLERMVITVDQHANTSSASVPLALNHLYRQGGLKYGQVLLLEAFAGGFAWGANMIRWSRK